jgi:uncharacterized membrane protein YhaH (DUF805 family)
MNGRVSVGELFLSPAGRAPRLPSLIAAAILLTLAVLYEAMVDEQRVLHLLTGVVAYPALFYAATCILSKRLHDRGRSGWWAALILISTVAVWPHPIGFFDFPFFLVIVWASVELAILPGEPGANRYGPNPLKPLAAA